MLQCWIRARSQSSGLHKEGFQSGMQPFAWSQRKHVTGHAEEVDQTCFEHNGIQSWKAH